MKKLFLLLMAVVVTTLAAVAQQRTVTGQVIYAVDGEPLIGATITPLGGGNATATNFEGKFTLTVPARVKQLQVSYVGMVTQNVDITDKPLLIRLSDRANNLDEVMVVAFGTAKKSAFTGSAAVVNADEIGKHVTSNVTNTLVGSVPGLQLRGASGAPGSGNGTINIRGINSLYASTTPLIIVDGAPFTASLTNIPTEDIESVSVLKDAASAALYGARGASGVIIITTKRGKTQEAQVTLDMKWGANSRAVPQYDYIKDPAYFYETYYHAWDRYFTVNNPDASREAINASANKYVLNRLAYNIYNIPEGEQLIGLDGKLNPNATKGRRYTWNGREYYMDNDDWNDLAYRTGFRQEYNVGVKGGYDRGAYYASLSYLNEEGVIERSSFERVNARLKADYQAKRWLKVGANISFNHSKTISNPNLSTSLSSTNIMYYTSRMAPIYPAFVRVIGANGQPEIMTDEFGHQKYDYGVAATGYGVQRPFLNTGNPLGNNRWNTNELGGNQLNGTFTADFTFTDFLKANATSTVIWGHNNSTVFQNGYEGPSASVNGALTKYQNDAVRTNNTQTITYFDNFGEHSVNLLVGHEYYRTDTKRLTAEARGAFSETIPELNAFATKTTSASYTDRYNVEGFFANAQYNYAERYFATASYRRDASSYFAKKHRWGNFWSVGAAWLMNKEAWFEPVTWIDQLKLKFSIGQQGNDNVGAYRFIDTYSLVPADGTSMSISFRSMGNPDLTWEKTLNINGGFETSFLDSRLMANLDLYYRKTTDLLFWLSVPESMGFRGYYDNIGDIRNSGVELTLTGSIVRTRDYEVSLTANITHNATKILKLPKQKTEVNGGFYEDSNWFMEGGPLYNRMCYAFAGINEKGNATYYVDPELNGATNRPGKIKDPAHVTEVPANASRYTMGSLLPKAYGGFGISGRAKWFDFSASFDYQLGGRVFDNQYYGLMTPPTTGNAGGNYHKDWVKSWTPENPNSKFAEWRVQGSSNYATAADDRWLTNASYLNFQSFTVGFTFPKNLIKHVTNIRIYASGENLGFISARKGFDPRYSFTGNESVAVYSPVRSIIGGLQVQF